MDRRNAERAPSPAGRNSLSRLSGTTAPLSAFRGRSGVARAARASGRARASHDRTEPASEFVEAWLQQVTRGVSPISSDQVLGLLEQALGALWREAQRTLGEVTLTAIASRGLYVGKERFPQLAALSLDADGFSIRELRERTDTLLHGELLDASRFLLGEFLPQRPRWSER